jgi:hypothetical protein
MFDTNEVVDAVDTNEAVEAVNDNTPYYTEKLNEITNSYAEAVGQLVQVEALFSDAVEKLYESNLIKYREKPVVGILRGARKKQIRFISLQQLEKEVKGLAEQLDINLGAYMNFRGNTSYCFKDISEALRTCADRFAYAASLGMNYSFTLFGFNRRVIEISKLYEIAVEANKRAQFIWFNYRVKEGVRLKTLAEKAVA